jgi:hypothetical protein
VVAKVSAGSSRGGVGGWEEKEFVVSGWCCEWRRRGRKRGAFHQCQWWWSPPSVAVNVKLHEDFRGRAREL